MRSSSSSWRRLVVVLLAAVSVTVLAQQPTATPDARLGAAQHQAEVEGNLDQAVATYRSIIADARASRATVATALLQLAGLYQKIGKNAEARTTYERVVNQFADQPQASEARTRLGVLISGARTTDQSPDRVVVTGPDAAALKGISPDGRYGVLIDAARGGLGVRDMSTGQTKWITSTPRPGEYDSPVFSPDLGRIAYSSVDADGHARLLLVRNEPGARPQVLVDNAELVYMTASAWSPDGLSILTTVQHRDRTWQMAWVSAVDGSVKVLKSLDWRFRTGSVPTLSPDGKWVAYSALAINPSKPPPARPESIDTHVYVLGSDGSGETELIRTAGDNRLPLWMPDGARVVFLSDRSHAGALSLWSVPVRDGRSAGEASPVKGDLTSFSGGLGLLRNGSLYYRASSFEQLTSVATIVEGSRKLPAPDFTKAAIVGSNAVLSPDGKSVALFRSLRFGGGLAATPPSLLVVHSLETGDEQSYPHAGLNGAAVWFHDGKSVAVGVLPENTDAGAPGNPQLAGASSWAVLNLQTRQYRNLTQARWTRARGGAMALDDKTLYFSAREMDPDMTDRIVALDLSTGVERLVFRTPPAAAETLAGGIDFALSPDGRAFVVRTYDPVARVAHIGRITADGTGYQQLYAPRQNPFGGSLAWAPDGIFFIQLGDGIMRLDASTGAVASTGAMVLPTVSFSLAPTGRLIAYNGSTTATEVRALDVGLR